MPRVASLLPATTEIVCALGCEQMLVGRSHECDFPPSVSALPVLTAPRLDPARPSREIDHAVKDLIRRPLSIYDFDPLALDGPASDPVSVCWPAVSLPVSFPRSVSLPRWRLAWIAMASSPKDFHLHAHAERTNKKGPAVARKPLKSKWR
jgi:hypothetical protein